MTAQLALLVPTAQGERPATIQGKLLARTTDPVTSQVTAAKVARSGKSNTSWAVFRVLLGTYGALTCVEASRYTDDPSYWRVEFAKRTDGWMREGLIGLAGERDGSRVWEPVSREEETE